ncbi:MAG: LacI family DNA-binding transcriptional regulator [Saccharofermentanales bacterium]|jgi:LacI family transcriptional regulator|nr:LacI family transcriptional regulator [Clostridiaceae bacterium]
MNIKRIAELAGVSVATVSRVINHPERVRDKTREHVLNVMHEYNYTPNWFAQSLNLESSKTIALLIPGIETNFFQQIISGVETVAGNKAYAVLFGQTSNLPTREAEFVDMMINRKVDGIIQVNSQLDLEKALSMQNLGLPRVHIGKNRILSNDTLCYLDIEEGALRMTRHLIELGHSSIMALLEETNSSTSEQMNSGFHRALRGAGHTVFFSSAQAENSVRGGYLTVQRLILSKSIPGALVTASDLQAIGAMKAARDAQIKIPDDMALASLTDSAVCSVLSPALTALELPSKKLGMAAARMLIDQIEGILPYVDMPHDLILQPKLKIRESCGNTQDFYEWFD